MNEIEVFSDIATMIAQTTFGTDTELILAGTTFFRLGGSGAFGTDNGGTIRNNVNSNYQFLRMEDITDLNATWFDIKRDGSQNTSGDLDNFFDYCIAQGLTAYFPEGTYHIPYNYSKDWGANPCKIKGDPGCTILTTDYTGALVGEGPVKAVKRVDLTKPKPAEDGFYQVDVVAPSMDTTWGTTFLAAVSLNDYVEIASGTPSIVTNTDNIIDAGYVLEVDLATTTTAPTKDGIYVIANSNHSWGGGFAHTPLWSTGLDVILGTVVERKLGTWTRYNTTPNPISNQPPIPTCFVEASADINIQGIWFSNFASFCIFPNGIVADQNFYLGDCRFTDCTRVLATETFGGSNDTGELLRGVEHKVNQPGGPPSTTFYGYSFTDFVIENCTFEYVHTSIAWFIPYCKNVRLENLLVRNCFTTISGFQCWISTPPPDSSILIRNVEFNRWRNYYPINAQNREAFKMHSNTRMEECRFLESNGIFIFATNNNTLINNYAEPYDNNQVNNILFWLKSGQAGYQNTVKNNTVIGGNCRTWAVGIRNKGDNYISDNDFLMGSGRVDFYSDSSFADRTKRYLLIGNAAVAQFKTVVGVDNVDSMIADRSQVYFEQRTQLWEIIGSGQSERHGAILYEPSGDSEGAINVQGGNYDAAYVLELTSTGSIRTVLMQGLTVTNAVSPIQNANQTNQIEYLRILDNPLLTFHFAGNVSELRCDQDLEMYNNTLQRNFFGRINLVSNRNNILFSGNTFVKDRDLTIARLNTDYGDDTTGNQEETITFTTAGGEVISRNNLYLHYGSRYYTITLIDGTQFISQNDTFDLRFPGAVTTGDDGKRKALNIQVPTEGSWNVFLFDSSFIAETGREHILVNWGAVFTVNRINVKGAQVLNNIDFDYTLYSTTGSGSILTNLWFCGNYVGVDPTTSAASVNGVSYTVDPC